MYTKPRLIATEDAKLLISRLESPEMTWNDSFELLRQHLGKYSIYADDNPVTHYSVYRYLARCLICQNHETGQFSTQNQAKHEHFKHCAIEHGYVFPENIVLRVEDEDLQQVIILSQLYGLPLPHIQCSKRCIKQFRDDNGVLKQVCAVHEGNNYQEKFNMMFL
jgi:hypothetical protein